MKPLKYQVKAGLGYDCDKFGVITDDGESGFGIEIMPHQWVGIGIWNGDDEISICLEWDCGVKFLKAFGYHSRYVETMLSIVSRMKDN